MVDGDAPAQRRRAVRLAVIAIVLICAASMPFARVALPMVPLVLPLVGVVAAVAQLLTAVMLYNRYRQAGVASIGILALVYGTAVLTSLAFLLSLPDAAPRTVLLHPVARFAAWFYLIGCATFAAQIVALARADDAERRGRYASANHSLSRMLVTTALVVVASAVALPELAHFFAKAFADKTVAFARIYIASPAIAIAIAFAYAYVTRTFQRRITMIRAWLGIVVVATLVQLVVSSDLASANFSVGWLVAILFWLVASSFFLATMLVNAYGDLSMLSLHKEALYEKSASDDLTGLLNRHGFNARFDEHFRRSARTDESLAVLLIDIDDFKRYNETFGHQSGDRAIASVARVIATMLRRAGDVGARVGGDEFAVILPKTDMSGAISVAERIRANVERLAIVQGDGARYAQLTVTIGVTAAQMSGVAILESAIGAETALLLDRADSARQAAKDAGRNCVRARQVPAATVGGESLAG